MATRTIRTIVYFVSPKYVYGHDGPLQAPILCLIGLPLARNTCSTPYRSVKESPKLEKPKWQSTPKTGTHRCRNAKIAATTACIMFEAG
jgi:hypothetical protein